MTREYGIGKIRSQTDLVRLLHVGTVRFPAFSRLIVVLVFSQASLQR